MYFLFKIFCFLLVFNYDTTNDAFVEFIFDAMSLGHSGLLITWKPNITTHSEETSMYEYLFTFENHIVVENHYENSKSDNDGDHRSGEHSTAGGHKIHSLKENTLYKITVKQYRIRLINESGASYEPCAKEYSIVMRTNLKSDRIPAKPYFTLTYNKRGRPIITWYPCGRDRICNGQESGTHFGITVKELYATRKLIEKKVEILDAHVISPRVLPGRLFEVVVFSVNGEHTTNSDPQEIFFPPKSSPVQYINIISLPDSSVLVSWKPLKQSLNEPLLHYFVDYFNHSDPIVNMEETDILKYILFSEDVDKVINDRIKTVNASYEQIRIINLKPDILYSFIIAPHFLGGLGFENRKIHEHKIYNQDLPIAKPDFNFKFTNHERGCAFYFQWLPCGQSFDCKNTKPGSNYSFQIEPEPFQPVDKAENGYYEGFFLIPSTYEVTLTSSIGNNFSEPVTKIFVFENCNEIREDIP